MLCFHPNNYHFIIWGHHPTVHRVMYQRYTKSCHDKAFVHVKVNAILPTCSVLIFVDPYTYAINVLIAYVGMLFFKCFFGGAAQQCCAGKEGGKCPCGILLFIM